ncbi:MAG: hypothetical protein ACL7AX_13335 [Candidatus Arsenophonus phytopathogenicus]
MLERGLLLKSVIEHSLRDSQWLISASKLSQVIKMTTAMHTAGYENIIIVVNIEAKLKNKLLV